MSKNLVIVESPAKAKTIEKFLGKDFVVKSSYGHIRDLSKNNISIDIENNFEPKYEIPKEKIKTINELRKFVEYADIVWLASDEDREGEAISWHLKEALGLNENKINRIVFNEITKTAITNAIENPRKIDIDLVNAQQARRVLDRLVGYELSPVLWKKVKPSLSAGRVQSVAVRLIVEREEEIRNFKIQSFYKIVGVFAFKDAIFNAELSKRFKDRHEALQFLKDCLGANFVIDNVETKPSKKSPSPPFTTSTLQQEASRKLGFPVAKTMLVAQQLYESGFITYMRTDSVNLSQLALNTAKKVIEDIYGKEYVKSRQFTTKIKGAQEAHEAIRPTYLNNQNIDGDVSQKKLYDLIWKRTIASQMSEAILEKTNIFIKSNKREEQFITKGEVIKFDGFLKVYKESVDDDEENTEEGILPPVKKGEPLKLKECNAKQDFSQPPARYTEASLVKKLEELGIGRPSTYAPTISTIQKREYVVKEDRDGTIRNYDLISLKEGKIKETIKSEKTGFEKYKLFPTDIGIVVNKFLVQYFNIIMDYNFTANIEKELDEIAEGKIVWNEMINKFYYSFHKNVVETLKESEKVKGERLLGIDPKTQKNVYVKIGRYGTMVQIGETQSDEKPKFAGLKKGQSIESITLEVALALFDLPRVAGSYNGIEMVVAVGRFGPYIKFNGKFYSLSKNDDPYEVSEQRCIEIIENKHKAEKAKVEILKHLPKNLGKYNNYEVVVELGKYGPYLTYNKTNYPLPKNIELLKLEIDDAIKYINAKVQAKSENIIKEFPENEELKIINGRFGAYIKYGKKNFRIPTGVKPENITLEECLKITETEVKPKKISKTNSKTGTSSKKAKRK